MVRNTAASIWNSGFFAVALTASLLGTVPTAGAMESDTFDLEILVDGTPLAEHTARGTTYIEALKGREYAIRLSNHTAGRIAVALAVDGLNSIDARSTDARSASKWVLGPHETIVVEGWQISTDAARRFFFTAEGHSYGAWLGETTNLGVIEAVAFREKLPKKSVFNSILGGRANPQKSGDAGRRSAEPASPESAGIDDDLAATGIGRKVDHRVRRVQLELEARPASQLRIRYEYRPQLVRLGVLPSASDEGALARRERARGFADFEFAPDPFEGGR